MHETCIFDIFTFVQQFVKNVQLSWKFLNIVYFTHIIWFIIYRNIIILLIIRCNKRPVLNHVAISVINSVGRQQWGVSRRKIISLFVSNPGSRLYSTSRSHLLISTFYIPGWQLWWFGDSLASQTTDQIHIAKQIKKHKLLNFDFKSGWLILVFESFWKKSLFAKLMSLGKFCIVWFPNRRGCSVNVRVQMLALFWSGHFR